MTIANILLTITSLVLFLLCVMFPLRKTRCGKCRFFLAMIKPHTFYACLLAVTALVHGILSGKNPGMISGKIAWMVLLVLIITSFLKRKLSETAWIRLHRCLSIGLSICICFHIVYAIVF